MLDAITYPCPNSMAFWLIRRWNQVWMGYYTHYFTLMLLRIHDPILVLVWQVYFWKIALIGGFFCRNLYYKSVWIGFRRRKVSILTGRQATIKPKDCQISCSAAKKWQISYYSVEIIWYPLFDNKCDIVYIYTLYLELWYTLMIMLIYSHTGTMSYHILWFPYNMISYLTRYHIILLLSYHANKIAQISYRKYKDYVYGRC